MHIALSVVKNDFFRELILIITPALDSFLIRLVSIIRSWILQLFNKQSLVIKKKLAKARLKIHISFDL